MADTLQNLYDPTKHFTKTIFQKGRVAVGDEWNLVQDTLRGEYKEGFKDLISRNSKGPGQGFRPKEATSNTNDFTLRAGSLWRNGERYTCEADVLYSAQRDENGNALPALTTPGGNRTDIVYLDVYTTEISAAQDSSIVVSLIGQETSRRTKKMALVRVLENATDGFTPSAWIPSAPVGHEYYVLAVLSRTATGAITNAIIKQWPLEIWVASTGNDNNGGLRQSDALRTIQEAINRVPAQMYEDYAIMVVGSTIANSYIDGTQGTHSFWFEKISIAGKVGQPRARRANIAATGQPGQPNDGFDQTNLELLYDGTVYPCYTLTIQSYKFLDNVSFPGYTAFFGFDGSITIDRCNGVRILGSLHRAVSGVQTLFVNHSNNTVIGSVLYWVHNNAIVIKNSNVDLISVALLQNTTGVTALNSTVNLYGTISASTNGTAYWIGEGTYALITDASADSRYSGIAWANTGSRSCVNNTTAFLISGGGTLEKSVAPGETVILNVAGGTIGFDVKQHGNLLLNSKTVVGGTNLGTNVNSVPPGSYGMRASSYGYIELTAVTIDGKYYDGSGSFAHGYGIYAVDHGSVVLHDNCHIADYVGQSLVLYDNSMGVVSVGPGSGNGVVFDFPTAANGSNFPRVEITKGSKLAIYCTATSTFGLTLIGYGSSFAGTKPFYGIMMQTGELYGLGNLSLLTNNFDSSTIGHETVANLNASSKIYGQSTFRIDSIAGATPLKYGVNSQYRVGGTFQNAGSNRADNQSGAGVTLTGHYDFIADDEFGSDIT